MSLLSTIARHSPAYYVRRAKEKARHRRLVACIPDGAIVVVCGGMGRSGSTWQYNVVKRVLELLGHTDIGSGWIDDLPKFAGHAVVIVKSHGYVEPLAERANLVFTSYRDLRDVLASSWRCFKRPPSVEHAHFAVRHFERWAAVADHVMRYEDLIERGKPAVAGDIVRAILAAERGVVADAVEDLSGLDPHAIASHVESLKADLGDDGAGGAQKSNQLYRNHVTDGRHGQWDQVPADVVAAVERQLRRWMEAKGYLRRNVRLDVRAVRPLPQRKAA